MTRALAGVLVAALAGASAAPLYADTLRAELDGVRGEIRDQLQLHLRGERFDRLGVKFCQSPAFFGDESLEVGGIRQEESIE